MADKIINAEGEVIEFAAVPRGASPEDFPAPAPSQPFRPGGALPGQPDYTELNEYQEGDPLPTASVTVEHPDGSITGGYEMQTGETVEPGEEGVQIQAPEPNYPPHSTAIAQTIGRVGHETVQQLAGHDQDDEHRDHIHVAEDVSEGQEFTEPQQLLHPRESSIGTPQVHGDQIKEALITKDGGVNIGGVPVNHGFVLSPVQVRHVDCNDGMAELTVTFLVDQVTVEPEAMPLVEEIPHHECDAGCVCQLTEPTATVIDMINRTRGSMRRFVLQRDRSETGMEGTGITAEGAVLSDGRALVRWLGANSNISFWRNLTELLNVHGHKGHTRLRWLDTDKPLAPHPDSLR